MNSSTALQNIALEDLETLVSELRESVQNGEPCDALADERPELAAVLREFAAIEPDRIEPGTAEATQG